MMLHIKKKYETLILRIHQKKFKASCFRLLAKLDRHVDQTAENSSAQSNC
jgi:hypothetical protein